MAQHNNSGFNPSDPLLLKKNTPEGGRVLYEQFNRDANGFSFDDIAKACINMLCNVIRQANPNRRQAEMVWDQLSHTAKGLLLDQHYDPITGKRRSVFPFTQHINAPTIIDRDKM